MKRLKGLITAVRDLVDLIGPDEIQEIEIERGFWGRGKIRVVRTGASAAIVPMAPSQAAPAAPAATDSTASAADGFPAVSESEASTADGQYHAVRSPMVGMFYRSPNPDSPAYVQEGDAVSEGQTVCIIEAMKIMNEIESDIGGRVVRVLVENATPVEYNTPLFLVDPQA